MEGSLNCLVLGEISFNNVFSVDICNKIIVDNKIANKSQLKVSHLKALIWSKKIHTFQIKDPDSLNLWKVNINEKDEDKLKSVSIEKDIEDKFGGELLKPGKFYNSYFNDEKPTENVRIIVVLPPVSVSQCFTSNKKFLIFFCSYCITFANNYAFFPASIIIKQFIHIIVGIRQS
jgi:hypothetical protein